MQEYMQQYFIRTIIMILNLWFIFSGIISFHILAFIATKGSFPGNYYVILFAISGLIPAFYLIYYLS